MPDKHLRIIKNSKKRKCQRCDGVHSHITRLSDDALCDVPVAFSLDRAIKTANLLANGERDIEHVTDGMTVVMDDSARQLSRTGSAPLRLAQFSVTERLA